jgi:cellulose synthase/poly-beta-1,6-N-acetylglucosamine synthase-like glycosyltransferase
MTSSSPLSPLARRWLRRGAVLAVLSPLLVFLAVKAAKFSGDWLLNIYGFGVLLATIATFYVAFTRYEDPAFAPAFNPRWRPVVTCLVAVKDEADMIEACVRSIVDNTYPLLQVIVVDDGSTDGTGAILDRLAATIDIQVLHLAENVGKKRALTEAARLARGGVFVFTDSDCVLAEDAIEKCVAALASDPLLGAVSGHTRAANANSSLLAAVQDVWYDNQFGVVKAAEASYGSVTCVSGPLAAFRRQAVINYLPAWADDRFLGKPFPFATDRQLTGYVLGQPWISHRLKAQFQRDPLVRREPNPPLFWTVGYSRSARVTTVVPPRLRPFLRQQVRWKKSFIRNLFFNGGFFWHRGPLPAVFFYSHVLWVLCAPFMAFRHLIWLPLHGGWKLTVLYVAGVTIKGIAWGVAYVIQNRGDWRGVLRPLMGVLSAFVMSWLLIYAALTLRRGTWSRWTTPTTDPSSRPSRHGLPSAVLTWRR